MPGPTTPLFVPEIGRSPEYARYFYAALGRGAIGFAPFGLDYTGYADAPLGAAPVTEETLAPFALNYRAVGPMMPEIARLNFEGRVYADVEQDDVADVPPRTLALGGAWEATVAYGLPSFGDGMVPRGNPQPVGRALIARLAEDQFLVTGFFLPRPVPPGGRGRRPALAVPPRGGRPVRERRVPREPPLERRPDRLGPQLRLRPTGPARLAFIALIWGADTGADAEIICSCQPQGDML